MFCWSHCLALSYSFLLIFCSLFLLFFAEKYIPLSKEAAKISSPFVTRIYRNKSQFIHWQRTACMISSTETEKNHILYKRQNFRAVGVQFGRHKCSKHKLLKLNTGVKSKQKDYINNNRYLLDTYHTLSKNSSRCLTSTERLLTNSIGTKCLEL